LIRFKSEPQREQRSFFSLGRALSIRLPDWAKPRFLAIVQAASFNALTRAFAVLKIIGEHGTGFPCFVPTLEVLHATEVSTVRMLADGFCSRIAAAMSQRCDRSSRIFPIGRFLVREELNCSGTSGE
jgi:hypothetical protein